MRQEDSRKNHVANNLSQQPQKFFDENRQRFEADTSAFDIKSLKENKCSHFFFRKAWGEVECRNCRIGYIDGNRFLLKDGKIIGVK